VLVAIRGWPQSWGRFSASGCAIWPRPGCGCWPAPDHARSRPGCAPPARDIRRPLADAAGARSRW